MKIIELEHGLLNRINEECHLDLAYALDSLEPNEIYYLVQNELFLGVNVIYVDYCQLLILSKAQKHYIRDIVYATNKLCRWGAFVLDLNDDFANVMLPYPSIIHKDTRLGELFAQQHDPSNKCCFVPKKH